MCSHAFSGPFIFWDFICLKSPYFQGLFSQSSLNGLMRFSHPVDTTDRRNTKVHLGVLYRQYYGFLLSSCPPALLSSCIIKNTSKKLLL